MMRLTTTLCAAVALLSMAFLPAQAQQQSVGFDIPTLEQVTAMQESRRSHALGDRLARAVVQAFEHYEASEVQEAINVLEALSPRSEYERAYIGRFLGTMYASLDEENAQPVKALELLRDAVALDILSYADQKQSLQLLGNLQLQEEHYKDAIDTFKRYLQFTGEWNADILFRMAAAHMELKNYSSVIPFARKAIQNYETPNRNPYVLLVGAYFELNDIPNAIKVLEEGVVVLPEQIRWWSQLGAFYAMNEQYDKALSTLAIAYDAGYLTRSADYRYLVQMYSNAEVPYHAGVVMTRHLQNGDIESTRSNWASAARSFYTAREFKRAAQVYDEVVKYTDDKEELMKAFRSQGDAYALSDDYRKAAQSFQRAVDVGVAEGADAGRLYMSLGEAHFNARQYRQAIAAMENASRYSATRRNAESWAGFIRETAERRGVNL
ncbi:tetratricopeptide repeat protein [Aliidiomarina quisquiliarum]|uniref:tetratricopeptide repeat protein n=1 Tax=Aliidiomarina quisquiliarum TaxID=2938947 RepID=UPI00208E66DB|nr:tetratricopeptide repeat protein [Aliidiomarina quisquiliarum]MCO4320207.1 hypothetical protein [Aliidiomarina quisquiliarum]